jgi:succinylglutamate desuccinylase
MRVERRGGADPEVAVVGGIHGDEPSGVRAVERLLADAGSFERPVAFVVANEAAVSRGERAVEADLNRSFPGDPAAGTHEGRLAAELATVLEGCTVLALHSTQSHADPFAIVDGFDSVARDLVPRLPVTAAVDTASFVDGRLFAADADVVEVEAGLQGSPAAVENATRVARAFLRATGALPEAPDRSEVPAFRLTDRLPKAAATEYEVFVENFQSVSPGEAYAAADGRDVVASAAFYPVLLSAEGYADVFGYAAERVGSLP